jgi:hypothetical protein
LLLIQFVSAVLQDGRWYSARIVSVTHGGYPTATYDVRFDGYTDVEPALGVAQLRPVPGVDYEAAVQPEAAVRGSSGNRYAAGSFLSRLHDNVEHEQQQQQQQQRAGGAHMPPVLQPDHRLPAAPIYPPAASCSAVAAAAMLAARQEDTLAAAPVLPSLADEIRKATDILLDAGETVESQWYSRTAAPSSAALSNSFASFPASAPLPAAAAKPLAIRFLTRTLGDDAQDSGGSCQASRATESALVALAGPLPDARFESVGGHSVARSLCLNHAAVLLTTPRASLAIAVAQHASSAQAASAMLPRGPLAVAGSGHVTANSLAGSGCARGDLCRLKHAPLPVLASALLAAQDAVAPALAARKRAEAQRAQEAALQAVESATPEELMAPGLCAGSNRKRCSVPGSSAGSGAVISSVDIAPVSSFDQATRVAASSQPQSLTAAVLLSSLRLPAGAPDISVGSSIEPPSAVIGQRPKWKERIALRLGGPG